MTSSGIFEWVGGAKPQLNGYAWDWSFSPEGSECYSPKITLVSTYQQRTWPQILAVQSMLYYEWWWLLRRDSTQVEKRFNGVGAYLFNMQSELSGDLKLHWPKSICVSTGITSKAITHPFHSWAVSANKHTPNRCFEVFRIRGTPPLTVTEMRLWGIRFH